MRYYPVYLDMYGRNALVIGGGAVGSRKAQTLLRAGARVTVVSPQASEAIRALAAEGRLTWHPRPYRASDLEAMFLVFGATDDPELNRRVQADAAQRHVLCNFAAQPEQGQFILPSIVERGDLLVSISTCGQSPAVARRLREELEGRFGEEYAPFLQLMGAVRTWLMACAHAPEEHRALFNRLIDGGLLALVKSDDREGIDTLLQSVLGEGIDMVRLMNGQ
jgi:precorrin-2 dehydrogenase/sirohydrochlorin ferrochelatase